MADSARLLALAARFEVVRRKASLLLGADVALDLPMRAGSFLRRAWTPVRWLLGLPPPRCPLATRMNPDDVSAIARAAVAAAGYSFDAMDPQVRDAEGRLLWTVDSATIGSGWRVEIDDATGVVGAVSRWGLR